MRPAPTEREVQANVVDFYRQMGCRVYNLAQGFRPGGPRHGTTRQTKGLADLWVLWPGRGLAWWHEVKRIGGAQTPEQLEFQSACERCGVRVVVGGVREAVVFVQAARGRYAGTEAVPGVPSPDRVGRDRAGQADPAGREADQAGGVR